MDNVGKARTVKKACEVPAKPKAEDSFVAKPTNGYNSVCFLVAIGNSKNGPTIFNILFVYYIHYVSLG